MTDQNQRTIQQLEQDVQNAKRCEDIYKQARAAGRIQSSIEPKRLLLQAEANLARAKFQQDIDDEMDRIEAVVDEELERIDGLNLPVDEWNICPLCNEDTTNPLLLAKKQGPEKVGHTFKILLCCGRKLCYQCHNDVIEQPFEQMEKYIDKKKREGGVHFIEDTSCICPNCKTNCRPLISSEKRQFKAVEKLAEDGIPWAMGDLAIALATGKYDAKKKKEKARKWLMKAAKANDAQSQLQLAECYYKNGGNDESGDYGLFGHFPLSFEEAYKWYQAAANRGWPGAYARLSEMHREGAHVSQNSDEALRYASLAVYPQWEFPYSDDVKQMVMIYSAKQHVNRNLMKSPETNLLIFWAGKYAEKDATGRGIFASMLPIYGMQNWHPSKPDSEFPGFSLLPLVKRLESAGSSKEEHVYIGVMKTRCGVCQKEANNLKRCSGCNVFHYCGRQCQLTHWNDGHKMDCKKKHWIEDFFPNLGV